VITLNEYPAFADAIDCMVSYFYKAGYNVSQYDTSEYLLHAQVATIADKYDCASLYKVARASFADTVNAVESNDWFAVAALIYDRTTTDLSAHKELRGLVVTAVADRPVVFKEILQLKSTAGFLRSNADLATDLLLSGPYISKIGDVAKYIFTCGKCQYAHAGSRNCAYLASQNIFHGRSYPQCGSQTGVTSKRHSYKVVLVGAFSCPSCDGIHTTEPVPEPQPLVEDAND
jgi:hypothetical protein